jgi:hypothetical protein
LCTNFIFAQQGSNLFQIITSDLSIQQEQVFRDLQTMLNEENSKELKGVDLQILHTIVDEYKNKILQYVQPLQIKVDGTNYTLTYRDDNLLKVEFDVSFTINDLLSKLQKDADEKLNLVLKSASEKFIKNRTATNILFFVTYTLLAEEKVGSKIYNDSTDYKSLTAQFVSLQIESNVRTAITSAAPALDLNSPVNSLINTEIDKLNNALTNLANELNDKIVTIFTQIQTTITNEVEKPLSQNLKGLTGFSASEGTGTFSGGALYSFSSFNGKARLSIYTNFNFNTAEDSVAHSLVGFRGAYIGKKLQIDALASFYYGDKQYNAFKVYEFGLGINYNFTAGATVGIAGFYTHNSDNTELNAYSLGIMFKVSKSSPSVILGFASLKNGNEKKPIIQINYPINVSL